MGEGRDTGRKAAKKRYGTRTEKKTKYIANRTSNDYDGRSFQKKNRNVRQHVIYYLR
jgi:hypothetical protein